MKKVISYILSVALLLTMLPVFAQAADTVASGTCGESLTWTLDSDGLLTISGTGDMESYSSAANVSWYAYRDQITGAVIGEGVTSIGDSAFYYCTALTSVTIPDSVTAIGSYAFARCTALAGIDIPGSVTTVGNNAFYRCSAMRAVTLADGLTQIGYSAFSGCTALTGLTIPGSVTMISQSAFADCTALKEINVENENTAYCSVDGMVYSKDMTSLVCVPAGLNSITFSGDAPAIAMDAFSGVTAMVYYPSNNATWTEAMMDNYGGTVTWQAQTRAVPKLIPKAPSLSFEGAVQYNVYYAVENGEDLALADMGLITFDTYMAEGTIAEAVDVCPGAEYNSSNGLYTVHTKGIPAKNLSDTVYFKVYAKLADGSYVYSDTYSYSAVVYAEDRLANSQNEEMLALVTAMLNYGATAQQYFDYKDTTLMNACLTTGEHRYDDTWTPEKLATYTSAGTASRVCALCGGGRQTRATEKLTVSSIAVTSQPARTSYYTGDAFDPAGMVVTATLSDGSSMTVTDYTVDKTVLTGADTSVTVSFEGHTANVTVTVSEMPKVSVSEVAGYETGTAFLVEGYYAGVAEEGASSDKELLIKDLQTDDIIAVRNVPYGPFPDLGYETGDQIRLLVMLQLDGTTNTPNKQYLDFSGDNGSIESTIVSTGNPVSYALTDTVKVSSWEEMQALFAVGTINEYTYVEITGPIYFNRYAGSDGVDVSRLHLNSAATGVSTIRTDGKRTVSLRDNIMDVNLGMDWSELFFDEIPATGAYPGYQLKGSMVALYTGANGYYYQLSVLDESWVELSEYDNYDIVTEVAYAYQRQGTQIQYDQTQSRRNLNPSPEDATAQNTIYLDCSSYVNSVYMEAFGVNVMPNAKTPSTANYTAYAVDNLGTAEDVIGYWENADYTTAEQISGVLGEVRDQLQVGDVLVYRHGETSASAGHVYIYVGNDTFLHCTGSSYNYTGTPSTSYDKGTTDEKTIGAVQVIAADDIFVDTANKRYLFKSTASDSVYNFCLLRPFNRGLAATDESKKRMKVKGIDVEKSVSVGQYNAVCPGDTVNYTIALNNTSSKDIKNVLVEETLPADVTYVSGTEGITVSGQTLTWTGTVAAGTTVTLTYSVEVSDSATAGALIRSSETAVGGVEINDLTNTVSGYTADQLSALAATAKDYAAKGTAFDDPFELVTALYDGVVDNYASAGEVLSAVIDSANKTCRTDTDISRMLVPNLYGGLDIKSGYLKDCSRSRLVTQDYLAVGDIIVAEYGDAGYSDVFVYAGDGVLIGINSTDGVCTSYTISGDAYSSSNILVTLIAYDRYAVLRPSMDA